MRSIFNQLRFFTIIPHQSAGIVERFGKYHKTIQSGINFLIPLIDKVSYQHSLKEETIVVEKQTAITKDNVSLSIDGVLFIQIDDPYNCSYNITDANQAVSLLALTVLRSEIGKMDLDRLFQEREQLNTAIKNQVAKTAGGWGLTCFRYEILSIEPPDEIKISMQYEAEAERNKRRDILISEGKKQADINISEGAKISKIYQSEAVAESIRIETQKEELALQKINQSLSQKQGKKIQNYMLSQEYLANYDRILQTSKVSVLPQNINGNGNDLSGFAAVMMMNLNQYKEPQMQNLSQQYKHQQQDQKLEIPQDKNEKTIDYQKLISNMKYYDDPLLYSSDEENNKFSKKK